MRTDDRTITERLALAECRKGDEVDIGQLPGGAWSLGRVTLDKVKTLPKGGVQIKFRARGGSTVRKADLPEGTTVERRRAPTPAELAADPSLAPRTLPQTAVRDGVRYVATDPAVDLEAALDGAVLRSGMPAELTDRHLMLGMHAFDLAAASLGMSSLLAGGRLTRID